MKIYIDESGDLGHSIRASPFFIISAVMAQDPLAIQRCFAKIRRNKLHKKYKELPEFKFNNSPPEIRKRILSCLASANIDIAYYLLRKEQLPRNLRKNHQDVYNSLTGALITRIIQRFPFGGDVEIIVDKSLNGIQREAFDKYLIYKAFETNHENDLASKPIRIEHVDSRREPCIQAADFIAGSLHYYYRTADDTYSGIIAKKIQVDFDFFESPRK